MKPAELRRHQQRGSYNLESVSSVFDDKFMAHVSYIDNGLPQCLPMIALLHKVEDVTSVYLHGHPSARLMELVLDGLVLSCAPNGHTFNYHCAVIHGECTQKTDLDLKREIMRGVTNHIVADRWDDVNPVASFQVSLVCVVRVDIESLSMKSRMGIPGIKPGDNEEDGPDREEPVWTGVVPLYDVLDRPVASGLTDEAKIPESLDRFNKKRNARHKEPSVKVA